MQIHWVPLCARQNLPKMMNSLLRNKLYWWKTFTFIRLCVADALSSPGDLVGKSPVNHQQFTPSPCATLLFCLRDFSGTWITFSTCMQGSLEHSQGEASATNRWELVYKDPRFPVIWWEKSDENPVWFFRGSPAGLNPSCPPWMVANWVIIHLIGFSPFLGYAPHTLTWPFWDHISNELSASKYLL